MSKQQYIDQLFNTMGQLRKLLETQTQESHVDKHATIMQYSALMFLKDNRTATVGDVASHLKLSKTSATQLIERLAKTSLVDRINDTEDRRIVRISITSAGEQQVMDLKKKYREKMGKIISKIPDEDLKELIRIHKNLIETLQREQNN
jgi:MarR family transcriptional regulator, organic hydroperoxide resistance regulator